MRLVEWRGINQMTEGFMVLTLVLNTALALTLVCISVKVWIDVKLLRQKEIKFKVVNVKNDIHSDKQEER